MGLAFGNKNQIIQHSRLLLCRRNFIYGAVVSRKEGLYLEMIVHLSFSPNTSLLYFIRSEYIMPSQTTLN